MRETRTAGEARRAHGADRSARRGKSQTERESGRESNGWWWQWWWRWLTGGSERVEDFTQSVDGQCRQYEGVDEFLDVALRGDPPPRNLSDAPKAHGAATPEVKAVEVEVEGEVRSSSSSSST